MLIPVNCAGVLRSVQQIFTGQKAAFCRTPKVENRISIPLLHLAFQFALFATIVAGAVNNLLQHEYYVSLLCGINAAFLLYGFAALIGFGHAWKDLLQGLQLQTAARGSAQAPQPVEVIQGARFVPLHVVRRSR
jgi:hypothetical protein